MGAYAKNARRACEQHAKKMCLNVEDQAPWRLKQVYLRLFGIGKRNGS
jgi:hypothetical protein